MLGSIVEGVLPTGMQPVDSRQAQEGERNPGDGEPISTEGRASPPAAMRALTVRLFLMCLAIPEVGIGLKMISFIFLFRNRGKGDRKMYLPFEPGDDKLPYPTIPLRVGGRVVEEYIIPGIDKQQVLEDLYLFAPVPSLDEERFDLHAQKKFRVGDYRVIRQEGANFLVSPHFPDGGGTVVDWMPVEWAED